MGYSKVYKDGNGYVVLVAHSSENPVWRGEKVFLTGLLHYVIGRPEESVEIFDGSDEVFYTVDDRWQNLNWNALNDLLNEADGITDNAVDLDAEYYDAIELYADVLNNELVRESLV